MIGGRTAYFSRNLISQRLPFFRLMKKAEPILNTEEFPPLCYNVVTIEKAELPSGGSDGTCYRYVVANSVSSVTGYRQGTKREVSQYCVTLIEDLNLRPIPK